MLQRSSNRLSNACMLHKSSTVYKKKDILRLFLSINISLQKQFTNSVSRSRQLIFLSGNQAASFLLPFFFFLSLSFLSKPRNKADRRRFQSGSFCSPSSRRNPPQSGPSHPDPHIQQPKCLPAPAAEDLPAGAAGQASPTSGQRSPSSQSLRSATRASCTPSTPTSPPSHWPKVI